MWLGCSLEPLYTELLPSVYSQLHFCLNNLHGFPNPSIPLSFILLLMCIFSAGTPAGFHAQAWKSFPWHSFWFSLQVLFQLHRIYHPPPPWKRLTLAFQTRASVYCQPNGANCREQVSLKREEEAEWRNASVVSHVNESILRSVCVCLCLSGAPFC